MRIAIAGAAHVGLFSAILLVKHNEVIALNIAQKKLSVEPEDEEDTIHFEEQYGVNTWKIKMNLILWEIIYNNIRVDLIYL